MTYTCKRCGKPMYLDPDNQSLVCSNLLCLHRDYRISCPLLEYKQREEVKKHSKNTHYLICEVCGRETYVINTEETRCWECRTNRKVRPGRNVRHKKQVVCAV